MTVPIPVNGYEAVSRQMLGIYEEAELVMLRRVVRRILKGIDSPGWTERKLAEVSDVRRQLSELLSGLKGERSRVASGALETAYRDAAKWFFADAQEYAIAAGVQHLSPSAAKVAAILADLNMKLDAADRLILRQSSDAYADVIGESAALMATGTITAREAVQRAVTALADRGITSFTDSAGRRWSMGTYTAFTRAAWRRASASPWTETTFRRPSSWTETAIRSRSWTWWRTWRPIKTEGLHAGHGTKSTSRLIRLRGLRRFCLCRRL